MLLASFFDLKLLWDSANFCNFYKLFPLTGLFLPCQIEKDLSPNSRGLSSPIFRRVCFDIWGSISLRKTKISQFLWNLRWFQVSAGSVFLKLWWFHRFCVHFGGFFFCTLVSLTQNKQFFGQKSPYAGFQQAWISAHETGNVLMWFCYNSFYGPWGLVLQPACAKNNRNTRLYWT